MGASLRMQVERCVAPLALSHRLPPSIPRSCVILRSTPETTSLISTETEPILNTMKRRIQSQVVPPPSINSLAPLAGDLRRTVSARLIRDYGVRIPPPLIRRVLDEAMEVAQETGFPNLFFPAVAEEKARLVFTALSELPTQHLAPLPMLREGRSSQCSVLSSQFSVGFRDCHIAHWSGRPSNRVRRGTNQKPETRNF